MHQGVQLRELLRIGEYQRGQPPAIDLCARVQDLAAEQRHHALVGFPARLDHLMAQLVSLDQETA
jgi:hypothetical protein